MEELELADVSFADAGEDAEAYPLRRDGRKAVDFFVADCISVDDRHPSIVLPCFDAVTLDGLAFVEPFHCESVVEGDGVRQANLKHRCVRSGGRPPEGRIVSIERVRGVIVCR